MSAMQVKDSEGRWQDVRLAAHEVAVVLGHTLQHASAGLLQPGTHRVVGDPYAASHAAGAAAGSGRRLLHFELRPRPAAVLDFRAELEAAGHTVSARWALPLLLPLLRDCQLPALWRWGFAFAAVDCACVGTAAPL
jgi:hypothetical protein